MNRLDACLGIAAVTLLAAGCATGSDIWDVNTWDTGTDVPGDTVWDPAVDPVYDPVYDPTVDPATDPGTDPGTDTGTDPGLDPGTDCSETPCGLLPNCGCPSGQKCYVNISSTPFVRECTAAGTGTSSSLCTSESGCQAGTQCLELITTVTPDESMCYAYCNSETDCPTDASVCTQWYTSYTEPKVCSHSCNPITNSGCPSGTKCMLFSLTSTGQDLTDCSGDAGYVSGGGYCTTESDCAPGTFCATDITTCLKVCRYPAGTECSGMEVCNQFVDPTSGLPVTITLDGTSYGYCY